MNFSLTINFNELTDIKQFIDDIDQLEISKLKKIFKKSELGTSDKRGQKTKLLHAKAKEYQDLNKDISYKQALKDIGKQIRENKDKDLEVLSDTKELIEELNKEIE